MADLFGHSILTHARHTKASRELADYADLNDLSKDQIVHSNSLASCLPMAVDGMGIAMLPRQIVSESVSLGRLVELQCDWIPSDLEVYARFDDKRVPRFVQRASEIAHTIAAETRR